LRKIPVLRLNFPRLSAREIFRLSTGIFFSQIPLPNMMYLFNTPPNMIYLFNYTEYYLEHWLVINFLRNFDFCYFLTAAVLLSSDIFLLFRVSNLINHVSLRIKVKKKYSEWIWRFEACEGKKVKFTYIGTLLGFKFD
jgi:hypothetical protein